MMDPTWIRAVAVRFCATSLRTRGFLGYHYTGRAAFTDPRGIRDGFKRAPTQNFSIEILDDPPTGRRLLGRKRELHLEAVYGG